MDSQQQFIKRIYQECLAVSGNRFRSWALGLLREVVDFDSAIWCKGEIETGALRSVTTTLLPGNYSAAFDRMRKHNPVYAKAWEHQGALFDLADMHCNNRAREDSQIVQRLLEPAGIFHQCGIMHTEGSPGFFTYMEFYKTKKKRCFSPLEKNQLATLSYHLTGAATHAFFVNAAHPTADHWKRATGLCDEHGYLFECQVALVRLLKHHYPQWEQQKLPFEVPMPRKAGVTVVGGLNVYIARQGDLFLLRVWERNPLDALTTRELEVAVSVAHGLTFKAIGKNLNLSESTIANHMYRAYPKLGISSRLQLAELVMTYHDRIGY